QAVALAAALLGSHATIVIPEDAPAAKLEATRGYGAEIVPYDRYTQSREELGARLASERGLELVKPYDDPLVMAGQGTAALELLEEVPDLDVLVLPVSGGGLIAGSATVLKHVRVEIPHTIADGLGAPEPGELTWQVNRELVDEFVSVEDAEMVEAMTFLF